MWTRHKIRQLLVPITGSLGVLCAGSSYFWINPNLEFLSSNQSPFNMSERDISWYGSIVEVGDLVSTLPSGVFADRFGRKTLLMMTGPLIMATWIIVQLTKSFRVLMVTRVLQGLAVGCIFTITPIYLGEVTNKKVRGIAGTLVQFMWYLGAVYQYSLGSYLDYYAGINLVCIAPAMVFTLLFWFCPESPRYFLMKNDLKKASEIFAWLYGDNGDETQLENITVKEEGNSNESSAAGFIEFLTTRKCLKSLFLVSVIAITNVIGVTPILSYSEETFHKITNASPSLITILMGCMSLVSTLVVANLVERVGRKPLLLFSLTSCTVILLIVILLNMTAKYSILQAICIALYPSFMSLGPGTLTYAIMAELFSDRHRSTGAAMITLIAAIATFLGLNFYRTIEKTLGLQANLFILSAIGTLSTIMIYKLMPETKGRTFEEIQELL